VLPNRGYDKPVCCFAPLLSGLTGEKMSASEADSTIAVTDDAEAVETKIEGAYCPAGEREDNGVLEYLEYLVFPVLERDDRTVTIERPEEYGGDLVYDSYAPLEADFLGGELHPADLKPAAGSAIADVIAPIRDRLLDHPDVLAAAYPESWDG
jgi:tyrosyl-tRNA synthetase